MDETLEESEERQQGNLALSQKRRPTTAKNGQLASQARAGTKSKPASEQEGVMLQSESPV